MENQTFTQIDSVAIGGGKKRRLAKRSPPKNMKVPAKKRGVAAARGSYEGDKHRECAEAESRAADLATTTSIDEEVRLLDFKNYLENLERVSDDEDDVTAADVEEHYQLTTYINENTNVNMANRCLDDDLRMDDLMREVVSETGMASPPEYHGWFTQSELRRIREIKNRWVLIRKDLKT